MEFVYSQRGDDKDVDKVIDLDVHTEDLAYMDNEQLLIYQIHPLHFSK